MIVTFLSFFTFFIDFLWIIFFIKNSKNYQSYCLASKVSNKRKLTSYFKHVTSHSFWWYAFRIHYQSCSLSAGHSRSRRLEVFCKKGVFRNFVKSTRKHLYQSLFCKKVAALRPATLLKKRLWHKCFQVNFGKFSRTPFLTQHLRWLLLTFYIPHSIFRILVFIYHQCQ